MSSLEYLEEERKKIWEKIAQLEGDIQKKSSDHEKAAKQSSKMASEYRNKSDDAKNQTCENLNEAQKAKDEALKILESIKESHDQIKLIYTDIETKQNTASEHSKLIEEKIESLTTEVSKIEAIFAKHPEIDDEINQFEGLISKGDDFYNKIHSAFKVAITRKNEIDGLYYDIMGYTEKEDDKDEEIYVEGLKDKIENSFNDLKKQLEKYNEKITIFTNIKDKEVVDFIQKWAIEIEGVNKKIQGLLPRALTAGLSYAYSDKKDAEELESKNHKRNFLYAIIGLIIVSIIPFGVNIALFINGKSLEELIINMPRLASAILPLYFPLLWLAYVANKNLNLSKRLIEEYTHKEVLSKTFEGLSSQISEIDDEDISSELRIKLIYNILEVSSENPGKLITDYNKADHPLFDALEKSVQLSNAVERVYKIPGMGKISKMVRDNSSKMLEKESIKAEKGLSYIQENSKVSGGDNEA